MAKLYETIDELIRGEEEAGRNPANYCFDEAWLEWVHSLLYKAEGNMPKACLAIELMKPSYFTDEGPVQWDMYIRLMEGTSISVTDCSPDRMTNFVYVFNMLLSMLEGSPRLTNPENLYSQDYGKERYSKTSFYSVGYSLFCKASECFKDTEILRMLNEELDRFARNSSKLGNYTLIPPLKKEESCNTSKATGMLIPVSCADGEKNLRVNDQFAPFLEWVGESAISEEGEMIKEWKESMLIACAPKLRREMTQYTHDPEFFYQKAAQYYKKALLQKPKGRVKWFTKYLKYVNDAIECRSQLIVGFFKKKMREKETYSNSLIQL